ncbi:Fpg/Nei family DNA glycosylase [Anatilimnocola floriformis]|uniref:Fpg/Nei family DNA glycosylase n=1 Tax=Anatilimnocola floriformis TaxID=2948575 RepID=UPI0020C442E6|nr:DNA-formamidopyrimidine glycosylase family protein [Anatilimnocola floriformis]
MPEGDTIHRAATRLRAVLDGQLIERAESRWLGAVAASFPGRKIQSIEARGKHLLIALDDDRVIHSHMGMTGSWHIYRPGEPWFKPPQRAAISLDCPAVCVVCFTPKLLEVLTATALRRHDYLNRLGPDLLAKPPSDEEVIARFRQGNNLPIGQAVMNQTIVSGIGNVYKSELLFSLRLHPLLLVSDMSDEQLLELTTLASELMSQNLSGRPRTTRHSLDGGRFYAYGRSGKACYTCSTPIEVIRQGDAGRTTYFCPHCQALALHSP